MNSLDFLYFVYVASILINVVAVAIGGWFVFPLLNKEARVKNGLIHLRQDLLNLGETLGAMGIITIIVLSMRFVLQGELARVITVMLVFIFSLGALRLSLLGRKIYNQQFSPKQKEYHAKLAALEEKDDARDVRREVARVKLNKDRRDETVERNKE